MEKYVHYSVVARKNPKSPDLPAKFYAQAQSSGVMGINEICDRLQRECTLTRADTMAVLIALEDVVADGISRGEIVRLGELCTLQLSVSGDGSETADAYKDTNIKKSKIMFRSGRTLRNAQANLVFKRVYTRKEQLPGDGAAASEPGGHAVP